MKMHHKSLTQSLFIKFCIGVLFYISPVTLYAQAIQGTSTPCSGTTVTYTLDNGTVYIFAAWIITNGTLVSSSSSGTSYSAVVQWSNTAGTGSVQFKNKTAYSTTLNVTINATPLSPSAVNTSLCGSGTITATVGSNGTTIKWYNSSYASNPLATSLTSPLTTATTTYYLSSLNATTGCESTTARLPVTVTINPIPGAPSATPVSFCGTGAITPTLGTNANSINWYSSSSGGSPLATSITSPSPTSTTTYYMSSYNTTTGCESTSARVAVTITIYPIPVVTVTGPTAMVYGTPTQLSTATAYSYQWKLGNVDISGATQSNYTIGIIGNYTVATKANATALTCVSSSVSITNSLTNQPAPVNYVSTTRIMKEGVTSNTSLYSLKPKDLVQSLVYTDGLGRAFQTVAVGQSGAQTDLINPIGYSKQGLIDTTFLTYAIATKEGKYRTNAIRTTTNTYAGSEQHTFYQGTAQVATDSKPFARSVHKATLDARVIEQGAPGIDWQPGTAHTVKDTITLNTVKYPVRYWKPNGTSTSNYPLNTVVVHITVDENGNKVRTYTNKMGQTVLKQVQEGSSNWLNTYFVYDEFGRLKYQVPPNAVILLGSSLPVTDPSVAELVYIYNYDAKGRLIEKKVPGAQWEYIVYDNLDRVCFTQDGNQRSQSKWMFKKYDIQGRPVYSGYYSSAATRSSLQTTMDAVNYSAGRRWYEVDTVSTTGYSNIVLPTSGITVLSINYYDNYDFDRSTPNTNTPDYTFSNADSVGTPVLSKNTRGLSTGSKIVMLNSAGNPTSNWLISVVFYDQYDRVVQTQSNNHLNSSLQDINSLSYKDLAGHIEKTKSKHVTPAATVTILQRYQYDDNWRTKAIYHSINGAPEQQLVDYTYNILGQLVDKKLHVTGNNYLQSVDLRYNIRGWLRSINGAQLTIGTDNDDPTTNDLFGMDILYNTTDANLGNTPIYNGSVTAVKWKGPGIAVGASNQRSYKFAYDKSDRLKTATFQASQGTVWNKEVNTLNESLTYDANGNILSLTRNQNNRGLSGTTVTSAPEAIDNLSYTYTANTNRIEKVEDSANPSVAAQGDFKNGATQTTEYSYTVDGSMMADKNKGIDSVKYNFQGKPYRIKFADGRVVTYTYDASGNKLKTTTVVNSVTTTNDYVGPFVYTNNALSFFSSPEGRVVKNGSSYEYQYAITDHQGNTRLLFTSAPQPQVIYTATMESENYAQESLTFQKLDNEIVSTAGNQTSGGNEVLRMNQSYPVGSAMSLKVYPGDMVDLEVYAYYESNSGYGTSNNTNATMITAIGGALSGLTSVISEKGQISSGVNTAITAFGLGANQGDEVPAAYLNYILFDQQYKVITMGWTPVTSSSRFSKQRLAIDTLKIKEAGIMYVYLSYENQSNNYVFFDEMKVKHTRTNVVQYNEYYPFGLQTANSWTRVNATGNSFLGNGGTELNSTSNLYELDYRNYDPALARMHQVDPMAAKYASLSPYNFSFNAPTVFTDVSGADPYEPNYWVEEAAQRKAAQMKGSYIESGGSNPFNKLIAPMASAWGSGPWGSGSSSSFKDVGGHGSVIIQIGNLLIDMSKVKDGLTLINFSGGKVQSILSFSDDDLKSIDRGTFEAMAGIKYDPNGNYQDRKIYETSSGEYLTQETNYSEINRRFGESFIKDYFKALSESRNNQLAYDFSQSDVEILKSIIQDLNVFLNDKDKEYQMRPVSFEIKFGLTDGTSPRQFVPGSSTTGNIVEPQYWSMDPIYGNPGRMDSANGTPNPVGLGLVGNNKFYFIVIYFQKTQPF